MNRIKELREEQGISREELAKLLGISVEELSDKVSELNDTIHSYGMFVSSQP